MMWDWSFSGWWIVIMLVMVIFWGGIIALVVWLIVRVTRREAGSKHQTRALEIARERYAKGEIGKEEFERIKKDLSESD